MNSSKGYMHALEGVIASMLVILYLGSIVTSPAPTDWTKTSLSKRSADILDMLSNTGILDHTIQNRTNTINTLTEVMETGMGYSLQIQGIPKQNLKINLLITDTETHRSATVKNTTITDPDNYSLPDSENNNYRSGTILGIDFILSDVRMDNETKLDVVNFDFNNDGDYGDSTDLIKEGLYLQSDTVNWCRNHPDCGNETYAVGYINDTLTLYNLTSFNWRTRASTIQANKFTVDATYAAKDLFPIIEKPSSDFTLQNGYWTTSENLNGVDLDINVSIFNTTVYLNESSSFEGPYREGDSANIFGEIYTIQNIMPFRAEPNNVISSDILFTHGNTDALDTHNQSIKNFLLRGNTLIELANYTETTFKNSIQPQLGLQWVNGNLSTSSLTRNSFPQNPTPGSVTSFIADHFHAIGIQIPQTDFTHHPSPDNPNYALADIQLAGTKYTVNTSLTKDQISLSPADPPSFTTWYSVGDSFEEQNNIYTVENTYPLHLQPAQNYRFKNHRNSNITSTHTILELPAWNWDTEQDSRNISLQNTSQPQGAPLTACRSEIDYQNGSFSIDGQTYSTVVTNTPPCNQIYDLVNFDFNGNNTYSDSDDDTGDGYSAEGPHENRDIVTIGDKNYQILIGPSAQWLYLERQYPQHVQSAVWSSSAYRGNGNVLYLGNTGIGDDDLALLKASFMRASLASHTISDQTEFGDLSTGLIYTDAIDEEIYLPYTIESVWWFR